MDHNINSADQLESKLPPLTFGQKLAEKVAGLVGSWKFLIGQSIFLSIWIILNAISIFHFKWDPYPFILMNLFLSLQAAYTAPLILISSNRQNEKDRLILYHDYNMDQHTNEIIQRIDEHLQQQNQIIQQISEDIEKLKS